MVQLWTCHECEVLLGINIAKHNDKLDVSCQNCGVGYNLEEVLFLDPLKVNEVINRFHPLIPDELNEFLIYRWLSNNNVGIIFDEEEDIVLDHFEYDLYEFVEDKLCEGINVFSTLHFE